MLLHLLLLVSLASLHGVQSAGFKYPSAPLLPIAPISTYESSNSPAPLARSGGGCSTCRILSGGAPHRSPSSPSHLPSGPYPPPSAVKTIDPCHPSPCGPNTRCELSSSNIARCLCLENFIPDGHTIKGCKVACLRDSDCGAKSHCVAGLHKCEPVCQLNTCGIDAYCKPEQHLARCHCPAGYEGNPDISCTPRRQQDPPAPPNPCQTNTCGVNAQCTSDGHQAICACHDRYEGNPIQGCRRSECVESSDCGSHQFCKGRRCINPCREPGVCGRGADCRVDEHRPICSCPHGYTGDAFKSCVRFDPATLCQSDTCGRNAECTVRDEVQPVCTCRADYIGDPLTGCRPECERDSECGGGQYACVRNKCVNPCAASTCGDKALCDVKHGQATCRCPQYYLGNPNYRCYLECQTHNECAFTKACGQQFTCVDPCIGACGVNALCRVDDHKPICSCPSDHKGHPFDKCEPFTKADLCRPNPCGHNADCNPGKDQQGRDRPVCTCSAGYQGDPLTGCLRNRNYCDRAEDCPRTKTCGRDHNCVSPCYMDGKPACGDHANCEVRNRIAVCACRPGYTGDPRYGCRVSAVRATGVQGSEVRGSGVRGSGTRRGCRVCAERSARRGW